MRLTSILSFLILNGPITLFAQKEETRFIQESRENFYSFSNYNYSSAARLPFKQIIVIDKRFDSSKVGYTFENLSNKYSKIRLEKSWSDILNTYFKANLDSNSNQSLVIIVQTFWMQFGTLAEIQRIKKVKDAYKEESDRGGTCAAELDLFVKTDSSVQALFRIDTTFLSFDNFSNKTGKFFFMPFDSAAKKIETFPVGRVISSRRKIKMNEIDSVYNNRFQIPVLKNEQPAMGIFLSFNDFKGDKPSIMQFKFKKGKFTDELYSLQNGKEQLIEKYWGFRDTSGLYISVGMNAFKAIRVENTFELVGFQHINTIQSYESSAAPLEKLLEKSLTNKTRKIFQVNMKTGKIN